MKMLIAMAVLLTAAISAFIWTSAEDDPVYEISVLASEEDRLKKIDGVVDGLHDLGYTEQEYRLNVFQPEPETTLAAAAEQAADAEPDVILSLGGVESQELAEMLHNRSVELPVVFAGMAAPVQTGMIETFEEPQGLFTGISNHQRTLSAKRVELFADLIPSMERIILLYNENIDISRRSLAEAEAAAEQLGIEVTGFDVGMETDYEALADIVDTNTGVMTLPSYIIESKTEEWVQFSNEQEVPLMGIHEFEVEAGFLAAYGTSFYEQGLQAARPLSLILQGNEPEDIPAELPDVVTFYKNDQAFDNWRGKMNSDIARFAESVQSEGEEE
ncbi:ABC transporter substrate binding protein [Salisediminibacterium halotolerans]|uniref:ABC transporter substrate binding protein n=1 Tax=Salisediminibacterium halotolerans TaxID=517425 RepID=UPI000F0EF44F|nr:ABC transporter substrate binding protein [Salisediminibacterium halotolerans]RLJ71642.1 putative ABC transport system substrate-binding protein [Actinophytocola xinjiangensis]RPE86792.1 putative ABC transport system substrate-binding protein [Salisediminibacterium halotolerans]TWG32855.1 putative ABC transport system substrate-binding protein [Salisediminibacterium halotolerans]GEL06947.1 ABC transporter substrate-binding protein [Salisediminibacterium halotolerans]